MRTYKNRMQEVWHFVNNEKSLKLREDGGLSLIQEYDDEDEEESHANGREMSGEGTYNEKTEDLPGEEDKIDIEMVDTLQINNDLLLSPNGAIASEEQP